MIIIYKPNVYFVFESIKKIVKSNVSCDLFKIIIELKFLANLAIFV